MEKKTIKFKGIDMEERDKMLKKMERNKKVSEKRREESEIRKFEAWRKSGSRTY